MTVYLLTQRMKPAIRAYMQEVSGGDYIVFQFPRPNDSPILARYKVESLTQARAIAADMLKANSEYFSGVVIEKF